MKLLMQPGSALLVMAALAWVGRLFLPSLPVIGGIVGVILWFAVIFGVIGGLYLLFIGRRNPA